MSSPALNHIAIIPDGNRRWARAQGKSGIEGHRYAVEHTLPVLFDTIQELDIPYCTLWLMSPENFTKRSPAEIQGLLLLLTNFLRKKFEELEKRHIKLNLIGDLAAMPASVQKELQRAVDNTKSNTGTVVTFAINYGGRDEIVRAFNKLQSSTNERSPLTKADIASHLDTNGLPDPDLIIRTGGEKRTSGFMLWQSEYAEYAFLDTLFPDFSAEDLRHCVSEFLSRQRRFGK